MVVNTQKTTREATKGERQEKEQNKQKIQNKIEVASRENNSLLVA